MKVKELIKKLNELDQDKEIKSFDSEYFDYYEIELGYDEKRDIYYI